MSRNLVLFDLDHTLLPLDSDYAWGEFLIRTGHVDGSWYRRTNDEFYAQYRAGTLDIGAFLKFALTPLASHERHLLDALHARYLDEVIRPAISTKAVALVDSHRSRGDLCAIVTATNAFVTRPIADLLGVAHLLATIPAQENGRFTGEVRGVPCYRDGKVVRVEAWLESQGLAWESFARTTFYSDSHNDLPLLERVSQPVATNPDPQLREVSSQRGWSILELFNDQEAL